MSGKYLHSIRIDRPYSQSHYWKRRHKHCEHHILSYEVDQYTERPDQNVHNDQKRLLANDLDCATDDHCYNSAADVGYGVDGECNSVYSVDAFGVF